MQNIIRLLQKFRVVLLFILLQIVCFVFVVGGRNQFHRASFASSSNRVVGNIYEITSDVSGYFHLKEENDQLVKENLLLKQQLSSHQIVVGKSFVRIDDTIYHQQYEFLSAKVINSSISNQQNYLTINIGSEHKVTPNMAVIGTKGVIGKTVSVSSSFATVRPIINIDYQMTARHVNSLKFGKLIWDNDNYSTATVIDVPTSAIVNNGDIFETRGDDGMFPEGIAIGEVISVELVPGETYQLIKIRLIEDFSNIYNVSVIKNFKGSEQIELENQTFEQFLDESNN